MAVEPTYLFTDDGRAFDECGDLPATHVAFAIDDLPELAEQLIDTCHYGSGVDPATLVALVVARLRGTTTDHPMPAGDGDDSASGLHP